MKKLKPFRQGKAIASITFIAGLVLLYLIVTSNLGALNEVILSFALLIASGTIIGRSLAFPQWYGIYVAGTKNGLRWIDELSKKWPAFWEAMPMWGLVLGFGLASYPLLKGRISKKMLIFGIVCIVLIQLFVIPYLVYSVQFLNLSAITGNAALSQQSANIAASPLGAPLLPQSLLEYGLILVSVVFGFSGWIVVELWANGVSILASLFVVIKTSIAAGSVQSGALAQQIAGAAPVIPGIDIPLFAGIISLAILLIAHEFSHGTLARRSKIKLRQMGVLVFGVIPIGGFVEPDEKMLEAAGAERKTKIFAAGTAANFVLMIIFFVLMVVTLAFFIQRNYTTGVFIIGTTQGYPAYNSIPIGSQILYWNGHQVSNISSLEGIAIADKPGSIVSVATDKGDYAFTAIASSTNSSRGQIGVELGEQEIPAGGGILYGIMFFLYSIFALSFMLNFAVAALNLLPIPIFDGWHIYRTNIKNRTLIKALAWIIVIGILINVLPLITRV